MKTGILTYQNTLNFGAALQCYALFRSIELMGIDVEIIDYRNTQITNSTRAISIATNRGKDKISLRSLIKSSLLYPFVRSKRKAFDEFNKKHVKFSNKIYKSNDEIKQNMPIYDKYIIGSDQLWNYNINGLDTTYFMDFVDDKSKVFTFASSFGLEMIEKEKENIYKKLLNLIPIISVREKKGAEITNDLIGKEVQIIPDPVFLISKEEWLKLIEYKKLSTNDTVCTYFLNNNTREKYENELNKESKIKKFKNVKLAGGIKVKDFINRNINVNYANGPIEFVKHIYEAKYIFTDSFHATVFSILLNKKFLVFLSGNKGRDSRIINLIQFFKIEKRIFIDNFENLYEDMNLGRTNEICMSLKEEAFEYLRKNLII